MAPWTRKMVVEAMRTVRFGLYVGSRGESLVTDWMCDRRKSQLKTG